jgi:diaminopimelate epimerase
MSSVLRFTKYEGLGNDFVVVDGRTQDLALAAKHAVSLCDRHRGVGGDGVLLVEFQGDRAAMRVINSDGSRPEMCGNGIRCIVLYLAHSGFIAAPGREPVEVTVDTDSGPHRCRLWREGDDDLIEVSMRAATLEPKSLPVQAETQAPLLDAPFEVDGTRVNLTCVSMGNPHAVTFDDIGASKTTLGPRLEKHPRFTNGANIGFATMQGPQSMDLAVFERGAGFTQACGTGACAAAVAAIETGRAKRNEPIEVRLPGGPLRILVTDPAKPILMTGPARRVFEGQVEL